MENTLFPLSEAHKVAAELTGRRYHMSSMYRWAAQGIDGVRLQTRKMGGARFTSRALLLQFFDALSEADAKAGATGE